MPVARRAMTLCLPFLLAVAVCAQGPGTPASQAQPVAAQDAHAELIERARTAVQSLAEKMPNFFCQQVTGRYRSFSAGRQWQQVDVLSATVVIESGKETYRDIALDGKPVDTSMEELGGTWSTGEFQTLVSHLFVASTQTRFTYVSDTVQSRLPAAVYEYEVEEPQSHWEVAVNGVVAKPAYRGKIWIARDTARVLRIEMQALRLPGRFPLSKVETTLEYEFIPLGDQSFLLPVRAESISCERFSENCARNTIEFRNYHRYTGESKIIFDK